MKKYLFLIASLSLISAVGTCDEPSKHTANYFRGLAPEYIGKKISLDVSAVSPLHKVEDPKFGFLIATTFDTRNRVAGGKIILVADKEKSLDLAKRYGVTPEIERGRRGGFDIDTLRLTGVLRETENKVLYLDVATVDVPADALKGLRNELTDVKNAPVRKTPPKGKPPIAKGKKAK
jgi:hypothetical protein